MTCNQIASNALPYGDAFDAACHKFHLRNRTKCLTKSFDCDVIKLDLVDYTSSCELPFLKVMPF